MSVSSFVKSAFLSAALLALVACKSDADRAEAYFLSGMEDDEAWEWRDRLAQDAPHVLAYGLRGVGGERAWTMDSAVLVADPTVWGSVPSTTSCMAGPRPWRSLRE